VWYPRFLPCRNRFFPVGRSQRELAFREVLAHLDAGDLPAALARVPACDRATAAAALAARAA
jgi:hypothetical protein